MLRDRVLAWALRVAWLVLPLVAGPALADALDPASMPVRTLASVGLWIGWAAGVLATLVPRPLGLTTLRMTAPGATAAVTAAAIAGHTSPGGIALASLTTGAVVLVPE